MILIAIIMVLIGIIIRVFMDRIIPTKQEKIEKEYNKNLSSIRIEHVNRTIKIFRIMKETYRNHQRRYDKKLKIMCTIYNMNLG